MPEDVGRQWFVSFAPIGGSLIFELAIHGLRRELHSVAAPRLDFSQRRFFVENVKKAISG